MRVKRLTLLFVGSMFLVGGVEFASQKSAAPLPAKILTARTVFVENRPGLVEDRARSEFFDEVYKWNRWRTVAVRAQADLIVVLTAHQKQPISPATQYIGTTDITFVDPATQRRVWSNSMPWSEQGAVRDLIGDLKQRLERQEKERRVD
jgi:hypothetical protein